MQENVKALISEVVYGDIVKAKKAVLPILEANTAKKDEYFCRQAMAKLKNEPVFMQLPANISTFATMEDVSQTFINERYFITDRERKIYDQIVSADKVGNRLAKKRIRHLNATLLYGESGTGKTTFGRYIAYQLGIPFLYLNFADLIDRYLGGTGKNIQQVFNFAKQQKCVFMLDEIDAIAAERGSNGDVGEMSRIVISLLQSLDSLGNDIIVIAATNRYDIIDQAVKRRFTRHHEVERLRQEECISLGKAYLTDCGYDLSDEQIARIIKREEKQSDIENAIISYIIDKEMEAMHKEEAGIDGK